MAAVSVLMSVHNGESFVADSLCSVLDQTFRDFEIIVVDDASVDATMEILHRFSDSRLKIIPLNSNVGLVDALNLAAEHATAPLLARIDADDLWAPEKLGLQVKAFQEDLDLVLLGTCFEYIDGRGRVFRTQSIPSDSLAISNSLRQVGNLLCHASIMMRADIFRKVGGYRKLAGRYSQDYDLWLRLIEFGRVSCLPERLTKYRCHEEMLSVTRLPMQRRAAEIYKILGAQRRVGGDENLACAEAFVERDRVGIRNRLAGDYLRWMELFWQMGRRDFAWLMLWSAMKTSPFGLAALRGLSFILAELFQSSRSKEK